MGVRIGVDIGGTFTDLVLVDERRRGLVTEKVPTTPDAPELGVILGLRAVLAKASRRWADVSQVTHGTTLVSNALIERTGRCTALVTTRGFRDVIEIGREGRYDLADLMIELPRPLVPRHRRLELDERVLASGEVLQGADSDAIAELVRELKALNVESVAVSFINSYMNPKNERLVSDALRAAMPGVFVTMSSDVSPQIREYERTSTAIANAFVGPIVADYIGRLETSLLAGGISAPLYVMLSSGGLATPDTARRFPILLLESGPAAGAQLAARHARQAGINTMLSFEMGGTTAKACVIDRGAPRTTSSMEVARVWRFKKGSGIPVSTPVIDLIEIGAGGGSIARVSDLGALDVGPDSAGAEPGPACYGLGGLNPTVTDADLILGYINPDHFLGGAIRLDPRLSEVSMTSLSRSLGVSTGEVARWIHRVVAENMASAARMHATERAFDLSSLPMFAFGGAGPVHAISVARLLHSESVIIPVAAGVGSAMGFFAAPIGFEVSRTVRSPLARLRWAAIKGVVTDMTTEVKRLVMAAGIPESKIEVSYRCAMKYSGQGFEVDIDLPAPKEWTRALLEKEFSAQYAALNGGITVDGVPIEATTWRVGAHTRLDAGRTWHHVRPSGDPVKGKRSIYCLDTDDTRTVPVLDRRFLQQGWESRGPLVIEETESTLVVPVRASVAVDETLAIVVRGFNE